MKVSPKLSAVILFLLASISGCSQSPTSVGRKIIPGSDKYTVHDTSIASISDTTFKFSSPNGSGGNLLVGSYASVNAKSLLLFLVTMPDSMTTVQIDTAELILTASYGWNVALPPTPVQFEIKEVLTPWSASTATADSFSSLNLLPTNSSLVTITNQDTLSIGREVVTQFDTSLVRRWINIYADTVLPRFFSIALVTKPALSNVGIWGFYQFGSQYPPALQIIYEKNGVKDSISLSVGEGTFLATNNALQPSASIETQAGISFYGRIKFNLSPVSDSVNKVIVNNAVLQLTLNNSQSKLGFGSSDSVIAYVAGSASTQADSIAPSYFGYGYRKDTTQTTNSVYIFTLTSMVQQWINTPSNNFGLELRPGNDASYLDTHIFYSSKDPAKGPKLFITYTKK